MVCGIGVNEKRSWYWNVKRILKVEDEGMLWRRRKEGRCWVFMTFLRWISEREMNVTCQEIQVKSKLEIYSSIDDHITTLYCLTLHRIGSI